MSGNIQLEGAQRRRWSSQKREEAFFACARDRDFVLGCFEPFPQRIRDFHFVFDDQDTHATLRETILGSIATGGSASLQRSQKLFSGMRESRCA